MPIARPCFRLMFLLAALALATAAAPDRHLPASPGESSSDAATASALCPIVYPLDRYSTNRGYRFTFFGNAFFINRNGYLITAAHVLQTFRDGGQPSILVRRPEAPPQLLRAEIIAVDWSHDVAILKASPNPFESRYRVSFLPLTPQPPAVGESVIALALHPPNPRRASTYQASVEDRSPGEVLDYQFTQEEKSAPETEMLLFGHEVQHGQSGSPVLSATTREVVGIVDGRWLRPFGASGGASPDPFIPGAAVPIHYALALLQERGIRWQSAGTPQMTPVADNTPGPDGPFRPLSLVPASYPANALLGGEVLLDAVVDKAGRPKIVRVIAGEEPFVQQSLDAIASWSFRPGARDNDSGSTEIAVAFAFIPAASRSPLISPVAQSIGSTLPATHAAVPLSVPAMPPATGALHGTIILVSEISATGDASPPQVWTGPPKLAQASMASLKKSHFLPATLSGSPRSSTFIFVANFRGQ